MPHRRHSLGKRRTVLAATAVLCISRSVGYWPHVRREPVQEPLIRATAGRPWLFGLYLGLWFIAGIWALASIRSGRLIEPMVMLSGLCFLWGCSYLVGQIEDHQAMWWQTGLLYGCFAVIVAMLVSLIPRIIKAGADE